MWQVHEAQHGVKVKVKELYNTRYVTVEAKGIF